MGESKQKGSASDHLANERTLLAWTRTSIGIMAFGFVVVKFSLFVKQLSLALGKEYIIPSRGYSAIAGILLVAVGVDHIADGLYFPGEYVTDRVSRGKRIKKVLRGTGGLSLTQLKNNQTSE
jgi:uncharacterized membrane protein YidH (DUF202 family)